MKKYSRSKNKRTTISLPLEVVPQLLGALKLGIIFENLCLDLVQIGTNNYDNHSKIWILNVEYYLKKIKAATGINYEDMGCGTETVLKELEIMVNKKRNEYKTKLNMIYEKANK